MASRRPARRRELLQPGNSHVGWAIHTFSLPAKWTCPGMTVACAGDEEVKGPCYALGFTFIVPSTVEAHRDNWERSKGAEFVRDLVKEIRYKNVIRLRIHVAGDFYSLDYIDKWREVVRRCPRITFYFYTRSWRVPELEAGLRALASAPNVFAWWSEDRDTGPCDFPEGRRCFMAATDEDLAAVTGGGVELVFRDKVKPVRKWAGGVWVCPKEQGTRNKEGKVPVTCSTCLVCLKAGAVPRRKELCDG